MAPPLSKKEIVNFLAISNRSELATWLSVSERQLKFVVYALPIDCRYRKFKIAKKNGGTREISAPVEVLATMQRKIGSAIDSIRKRSLISNGFERGRSIYDHAKAHKGKSKIITVDIEDYFNSINFGRVRGIFLSSPFLFSPTVATLLAQICTDGKSLPQGAPSSPSIANLACVRLDRMLVEIASKARCSVSRYADDICFSTGLSEVPKFLAYEDDGSYLPSNVLADIFKSNGFSINKDKFAVRSRNKAMVTGLKFHGGIGMPRKWRRRLRSELQVCRKYGDEAASIISSWTFGPNRVQLKSHGISSVAGKVGYLHWLDGKSGADKVRRLAESYGQLAGIFGPLMSFGEIDLLVEGMSDEILLNAALRNLQKKGMFEGLKFNFLELGKKGGPELEKSVRLLVTTGARRNLTIALFDCDDNDVLTKVGLEPANGINFRRLSDGIYVAALRPAGWTQSDQYCIESLLRRDTFELSDISGRKLFLSSEFSDNGLHHSMNFYRTTPKKKTLVVDSEVYCVRTGASMALSKIVFAQIVASGTGVAEDFYGFVETFKMLYEIHLNHRVVAVK
ncbi:reverse transcriptase domain-containing protein [Xanthomonas sp. D-109]|uniref:reverse transcriptase domain-containing protein n=1 Tax=Xanthomonas sp. D-109 TaxID=2821274 RepID=UPI001ADA6822|nr:reverse transcriptase domain-containing protein [Xanthomonas sp. D-109]MBO9882889.1 RNA-directed DNA polymerase [Xanthomonas sp. D-109]